MNFLIKKRRLLIACLGIILFCTNPAKAQNLIGFTSNYAGAISTYLNPSSICNSKVKLDVNLFTFGGHLQNNLYYIPKSTYKPLNPFENGFADINAYQGYNTNNKHNYLYTKEQLHLPSVMYSNGKRAFGFHLSLRLEADAKNVPNDIIRTLYEGMLCGQTISQDLNTDIHADKFHFAAGLWEELGATYSQTLINNGHDYLAAGVTANLLLGNAAYYYNNKEMDYYFQDTSSVSFNNVNADFGGVIPTGFINGYGLSVDLGVTYCMGDYLKNRNNTSGYFHYKYKFGAAILDFGGIRYGKGLTYKINSYDDAPEASSNTLDNLQNLDDQISGLQTKNHLNFYLPTALSLQFDYNINDRFFVGANYIQNLRFTGCQVRRPTVLAVTPRYESKWFDVSMPLSLYDWKLPRIGFEMRIFYLVFGTEKLGWLFKINDCTGVDAYVSLRFFLGKKNIFSSDPLFKGK
jgi:hypothetical protein